MKGLATRFVESVCPRVTGFRIDMWSQWVWIGTPAQSVLIKHDCREMDSQNGTLA